MESLFVNTIKKLDLLFDLPHEERVQVLNQAIKYLNYGQYTAKILFHSLQFSALLSMDEAFNVDVVLNFLENNKIEYDKEETADHLTLFLLKTLLNRKKHESLSIKDYIQYVDKLSKAVGGDLSKTGKQHFSDANLFNHCIACYGFKSIYEIKKEIDLVYKNSELTSSVSISTFFDFIKDDRNLSQLDPHSLFSAFNFSRVINVFLDNTLKYFDPKNPIHLQWMRAVVQFNQEEIYAPTFIEFIDKNHVPELEELFLNQFPVGFLKDTYCAGHKIKNFKLQADEIKHAKDFKELVLFFYGKTSKKITRLVSELCYQGGVFNFSYLYLGEIIGGLDINKIQEILSHIIENKVEINLTRYLLDHEKESIDYLVNLFPKKRIVKFLFSTKLDLSSFSLFTLRNHKYLDKIYIQRDRDKNIQSLIKRIDVAVEILKTEGYSLPVLRDWSEVRVGDYMIQQPKNNIEVMKWGQSLNNCLVNEIWAMNVYAQSTLLFGLFLGDRIYYAIEINENQVKQLEGKARCIPDEGLQTQINEFFLSKGLIYDKNK